MNISAMIPVKTLDTNLERPLYSLASQKDVILDIAIIGGGTYSEALNRGLRESKTEFVFCIHSDTWLEDDHYVIKLLNAIVKDDRIAVVTGGNKEGEVIFSENRADVLRRSALLRVGGYVDNYGTDQMIAKKLRANGYKILRVKASYKFVSPSSFKGISKLLFKTGYAQGFIGVDKSGMTNPEYRNRMFGRLLMLLFPPYLAGVLCGLSRRLI